MRFASRSDRFPAIARRNVCVSAHWDLGESVPRRRIEKRREKKRGEEKRGEEERRPDKRREARERRS